ncbi:MAG TPA: alkaline phosphatase family protein [Vicinamibacterales bacterium]|nr:alkaline phosphatase family protein [Vicinamibacterales bacterium]
MKKSAMFLVGCVALALIRTVLADEGDVPRGIPHLDHVFVIMMENHAYGQIVNNPNAPFANQYAHAANTADNYFAIAHPSLTNYLEVVGGSNFGVLADNPPDWHSKSCTPNIESGIVATDNPPSPPVCPIEGAGTDAATAATDTTNEISPPSILKLNNIDGIQSIPAAHTVGKTIADQLVEHGRHWKSYQESLPPVGADRVNNSDGFFTDPHSITPLPPAETQSLINLYAVKHNPFVYFQSVQEGADPDDSLRNVVGFEGSHGLFDDLSRGEMPDFAFIAPNQCNDQHGRGNAGPGCDFDFSTDGTQAGLNPGLIYLGDLALKNLVGAIHRSDAWRDGTAAIVVVWDENDYSGVPNVNKVLAIVETNYGVHGVHSTRRYTHFSLLKSIQAGLGLPCLNHTCDATVPPMNDLFGSDR